METEALTRRRVANAAVPEERPTMERLRALAGRPAVQRARRLVHETDEETLRDLVELTEIPAPPFGEAARGRRLRRRFEEVGLEAVAVDGVGNVLARLPGAAAGDPVILSAHLDTVFPADTVVRVRREGDRLLAPGIADNGRGLAALLAVARALVAAGVRTRRPLVLVASVGEEGIGDLRGLKHLFRDESPWRRAAAFIGLDGSGSRRVVHRALGSQRLRATVTGPGGHSWADWGRANPIHALGRALSEMTGQRPPRQPRTTLTVGRIGGGTSVNAIPSNAWIEIDLRSEGASALRRLEQRVLEGLRTGVEEANAARRRGTDPLSLEVEVIGSRPSGVTAIDSPLVQAAVAATEFMGEAPELVASSTDANVPIGLGIPAITLGAGGESGGTHTTEEWFANDNGPEGIERALLVALAAAED